MTRKMKDSGIEWIGEIPEDWKVVNLKSITKNHYSGGTPTASKENFYSSNDIEGFPFMNISDITNQMYITSTVKSITEEGIENKNLQIVPKGSILYAMYASVGKLSLSEIDLYISQAILAFDTTRKVNKSYLIYYLNSLEPFVKYFSNGTTQVNLNAEIVKNFKVLLPKKEEQKSIADFLDEKTQEINNIISKTKKAVEEYKKYKQSLITETVTKGLDENVEMKNSGIEWIGNIPEHWKATRLKYLLKEPLKYGANSSGSSFDEKLPRYIRITDINKENQLKNTGKLSINLDRDSDFILEDRDILFARSGATVGKTILYKSEMGLSAFAGYLIRARINSNNLSEFIYYITLSSYYEKWKDSILIQATIENIGADKYNNLIISVPPIKEQKEIIKYLDKKTKEIDQIISTKEKLLTEMEAYKKSLIYETVTGKREVE